MIELAPLRVSTLYLFQEQTHRGCCVVAAHAHVNELFGLPDALRPGRRTSRPRDQDRDRREQALLTASEYADLGAKIRAALG